jgi:hypothetical protein
MDMDMTEVFVIEERVVSSTEAPRPPATTPVYLPPQSTVQLAHATSDAVISGLAKSPYLLGVVVLVAMGVGSAIYFLQILITGQATHLKSLLEVQNRQQTEIITLHKQEFDALLEMANRLAMPLPPALAPPPATTPPPPSARSR